MTWYVSAFAPLTLPRGIASSTKPRAQRRCTSHEQGTYTKASPSTSPWQMLSITRPPLPFRAALVNDPLLPLAGIARRATAIASAMTSSLCCWMLSRQFLRLLRSLDTPGNVGVSLP